MGNSNKTIVVVGAGAAGMMAAAQAKQHNPEARVVLLEKNARLGQKVIISGGGRCNVTTGIHDVRTLLTKYPRGGKFLTSAMYNFPPDQVYDWFEAGGVPLKIEADNRAFPQSNDGRDVVAVFDRLFAKIGVEIQLRTAATQIEKIETGFLVHTSTGREKTPGKITADALILTTGGQAYRHTGSTGDGYNFAEAVGHTISPLSTSLNSFVLAEAWAKDRSGVSFERIGISVPQLPGEKADRQTTISSVGPAVFTHQGISGPAVFVVASHIAFRNYTKQDPQAVLLDFLPDVTEPTFTEALNRSIDAHHTDLLKITLHSLCKQLLQQHQGVKHDALVPASIIETMLQELHIPLDQTNASTSKAQRNAIVQWLKRCQVSAVGRGAGAEFVTAGGVELAEVDPRTMQSKICPGLFFAGEILHFDGYTGGFNLQAAWATGRLAGESVILGN